MSKDLNNSGIELESDVKEKMLVALANKQKGKSVAKNSGSITCSKIGAGQTIGSTPRIHRRKAGSS